MPKHYGTLVPAHNAVLYRIGFFGFPAVISAGLLPFILSQYPFFCKHNRIIIQKPREGENIGLPVMASRVKTH